MYEKYCEALLKSELSNNIQIDVLDKLLQGLKPEIRHYNKNDFIYKDDEKMDHLGIVLSGVVCCAAFKSNGDRCIIEILEPGKIFGQILLFMDTPRSSSGHWYAKSNCTIMYIEYSWFNGRRQLGPEYSQIKYNIMTSACNRGYEFYENLKFFRTRTVREKISIFLYQQMCENKSSTFMLPYNRNELSDFLNIPRPSLSRELACMKNEGLIDYYKSTIKMLDIEYFKQFK